MAINSDVHYVRYYTAGSAARELAPQIPLRTKAAQKARKPRKSIIYIDPVAIIGVVTAIIMVAVMILGVMQLNQLKEEASAMQNYVLDLKAENTEMTPSTRKDMIWKLWKKPPLLWAWYLRIK